ncbi:MAG: hypothetical protein BGO80_09365 [Devosia sp. 63-57]|nr:MAG: hypothetical protein ABS74_01225 [Pelagibacterium sp. SCN 63-126]ODU86639.1 MAG: hypothetical protein ABT14_08240 [Pelagibacterium sp. SCN 63-17]OJX43520.1 MAG: hypothetical protein BGO80_09365 [Devosia sp. 63-57]
MTLKTDRLILRSARPDDAPSYTLGIGEFAVARWLTPVPWPCSLAMAMDWLRQTPRNTPEHALFIIERPGKGLIGSISLMDELGFWIARPFWGRGYGTEAAAAVISWHFSETEREAIPSSAHHDNAASLRLQHKLGFVDEGHEMRYSQALQNHVDHVITRLTRTAWQARGDQQCA